MIIVNILIEHKSNLTSFHLNSLNRMASLHVTPCIHTSVKSHVKVHITISFYTSVCAHFENLPY